MKKTNRMIPTWIINGTLVTQNNERQIFKKTHFRIEQNRISEITQKLPRNLTEQAEKGLVHVVDAKGLHLLPGFVQGHVHLCQTLFRNMADDLELLDWLSKRIWIFESQHTPETLYTSAALGIYELLTSGTTTCLDMGTVRHTESILEAAKNLGIRASIGKCLMDHPTQTPPQLRETTRDALTEATQLFEKWNGKENDRIRVSYAPRFVISCTEKLLLDVADRSRSSGALIHTHASENLKEIQLVKRMTHCENIEYFHQLGLTSKRLVLAHCIWLKPNEKDILRETQTNVIHCPSSNLKLASGFAHVPDLRARGITVGLGADGAPCSNNLNMFTEMRLAALIHKPGNGPRTIRAVEALDMATREGAKALSWDADIGSIEIGKKADIIAINLNQLENLSSGDSPEEIASSIVYSSDRSHLRWTMVDGKIVFATPNKKPMSASELKKRVKEHRKLILKKSGVFIKD